MTSRNREIISEKILWWADWSPIQFESAKVGDLESLACLLDPIKFKPASLALISKTSTEATEALEAAEITFM